MASTPSGSALRRPLPLLLAALVVVVAATAVLLGGRAGSTAAAQTVSPPADRVGIRVVGVGTVKGRPDVMRLDLSVQARAADVDAAMAKMTAAYDGVRAALQKAGVKAPDVQTSDLSLYPVRTKGGGTSGFTASESMTVTVRDLTGAGRLVSQVVAAGGSAVRLQGIAFGIEQDGPLLARARVDAVRQARAKAETYAAEAGRRLGRVVAITEDVDRSEPYSVPMAAAATPRLAVATIDRGTQALTARVTVDWSFAG